LGHSGLGHSTPVMTLIISTMAALVAAAIFTKKQAAHLVTMGLMALGYMVFSEIPGQRTIFKIMTVIPVLLGLWFALDTDRKDKTDKQWALFAIGIGFSSIWFSAIWGTWLWTPGQHAIWAFAYFGLFIGLAIFQNSKASSNSFLTVIFTLGAALFWTLAAGVGFDGLPVSLALSAGAALMVAAYWFLRLPGARAGLLGLAGLVFAHALLIQFPDTDSLSPRPIINALWAYLALPAAKPCQPPSWASQVICCMVKKQSRKTRALLTASLKLPPLRVLRSLQSSKFGISLMAAQSMSIKSALRN